MLTSASQHSVSYIIQACAADTHPPLFDIILHYVLILSNDAEFAGRYLALTFGMLGLFTTYYYAKKITHRKELALFAMAIVAFNHFHIIYSIESRFYTLIYLLSLLVIGEVYLYLKEGKVPSLIKFSLGSILLVYTHYYGGILLASISIVALVLLLLNKINRKTFWMFAASCLIVLMFFLPWLPNMLDKNTGSSWMTEPSVGDFFNYYYLYSGKNPLDFMLLFIPLLFSFKVLKKYSILLWLLYGTILLGFILPFIVSHFSTPLLHKRYTFIYLPSVYLMAAIFWYEMPQLKSITKKISYALLLIFTSINILFLRKEYKPDQKDQWKEVSQFLENAQDLPVYTEHRKYLNFYLKKEAKELVSLRKKETGEFWLLKTNYDQKSPLKEMELVIMDKKLFPNKFELYKVRKQ